MSDKKTISLVGAELKEDFGICDWCFAEFKDENHIYKVRGDFVCRECVERMYEERED
jgi:hypothetical protein